MKAPNSGCGGSDLHHSHVSAFGDLAHAHVVPKQIVGRPDFLQGGQLEDLTTVDGEFEPSMAPPEQIKDHPGFLQGVLHYDPAKLVFL